MTGYGQFCAVARALEVLGERWTLLVVRELLLGARRFTDLQCGLPRISRTMLSARLKTLQAAGVVERTAADGYRLTEAGRALQPVVRELGAWAMEWDRRGLLPEHLDPEVLTWDLRRRTHVENLPAGRTVVEFVFPEADPERLYLHVDRPAVTVCRDQAGYPVDLRVRADLEAMTRYWLGEVEWPRLLRSGAVSLEGPADLCRAFPTWFSGYVFAVR
ncbi:winged helix-turn-helix transcriptional regulator [Peterkaempfera sp. SMS 1(5)a]|uniref:winged helix-turn-helix transcriptional regulator n=1 Tax=Peterkaempfera podocarpi TaxID=3232308 RepID=UPI0036719114